MKFGIFAERKKTMLYNLYVINGYPLADISGGLYLLDTGCPMTGADGTVKKLMINDEPVIPYTLDNSMIKQLELAVGTYVNGIIGFDTIARFGGVLCDKVNKTVTFGRDMPVQNGNEVPLHNGLHFIIKVNGKYATAFLDTGAPLMMVDKHDLLDKSRYTGTVKEPSLSGVLTLESYKGEAEFGGVRTELTMLKSSKEIMRDGSDVYFSPDVFAKEFYMIDIKGRRIVIK